MEAAWSPEFSDRAETIFALSNGYIGVRGTPEEGRPTLAPGTFVSGLHETWPIVHAEEAYGLARVGQSIVNVPDATVIELFVDDEPLVVMTARFARYQRVLDMREGTLRRDLVWRTPAGKHVTVRTSRLVSLEHRHVLATEYTVTVDRAAPVALVSRVLNRTDAPPGSRPGEAAGMLDPRLGRRLGHRVLQSRLAEDRDGRALLGYQVTNSGMTLAVAADHHVDAGVPHRLVTTVGADLAETVLTADAQPGVPIRMVKYVTYQTPARCRRATCPTAASAPSTGCAVTATRGWWPCSAATSAGSGTGPTCR